MFILTNTNSIANHFIAEMRDVNVQQDALRFRKNMERLGEILAYEVSKTLRYQTSTVQSPLAETTTHLLIEQPVLVAILRASLPFHQGFLNVSRGLGIGGGARCRWWLFVQPSSSLPWFCLEISQRQDAQQVAKLP